MESFKGSLLFKIILLSGGAFDAPTFPGAAFFFALITALMIPLPISLKISDFKVLLKKPLRSVRPTVSGPE
ncbi:MAG: hypothetical protein ACTSRP_09790 [Candidatus Helarchaeota archaeon]